jgi:nucleoside-diphosphate-sugar epimerase
MRALVIGGTAGTGPPIIEQLFKRDYEVTIYHRGVHEVASLPSEIEHIHGEPHFEETITHDLEGRSFDLVVATYGRIRYLADALKGKTPRLITIGGFPVMKGWLHVRDPHNAEHDGPVLIPGYEDHELEPLGVDAFVDRMIETERAVLDSHAAGHYQATHFRYPYVYGPHSITTSEWMVMKRVLDSRKRFIIQGGGLSLSTRCASVNVAHAIGLAIDDVEASAGQIYHLADDVQFTQQQWVELIAGIMDYEFEFVEIPWSIAPPGHTYVPFQSQRFHRLMSNSKLKAELGYTDAIAPQEWVRTTVEWWLEHPPTVDGTSNRMKPSAFDYEHEDRLLAAWDDLLALAPKVIAGRVNFRHPYPHPKQLGDLL